MGMSRMQAMENIDSRTLFLLSITPKIVSQEPISLQTDPGLSLHYPYAVHGLYTDALPVHQACLPSRMQAVEAIHIPTTSLCSAYMQLIEDAAAFRPVIGSINQDCG